MNALLEYDHKKHRNVKSGKSYTASFKSGDITRDETVGDIFMGILENGDIKTVFQPIISLKDGEILGYEALSRGPEWSVLENPSNLFDVARMYGKLWELEFLCRIKALENMSKINREFNIFLNVDPQVINDDKFRKGFTKEFLKKFGIDPENVIFEITEKNSISDIDGFKKVIKNYKEQGYKIAIDDTGSGYSGLKLITDIHPHFIKLDMDLIRDIDKDGLKYALIKTLYEFCMVTDIKVIAEGIETEDELNALIDIGINYGQGYFIQKPLLFIPDINPEIINSIKSRNLKKRSLYQNRPSTVVVGDISRSTASVNSSYTGANLLDIFNTNPSISGIPVVDNGSLTGLVMKDKFYAKLGTQYGFALFINRPVSLLMDNRPLSVDYNTTLDIVSKLAMTRSSENLYDYIVVTKDSGYCGIVTVKDLLEKTIELEVSYAKHLNPLSGLPGNMLIEHNLGSLIAKGGSYAILYIDIDNFKVYNDVYGFENGDRIIQFVARIIEDCVGKESLGKSFLGHVGGDDFVISIEDFDHIDRLCSSIISIFEKGINNFYNSEDLQRGYVAAKNRRGEEELFGVVTMSIACVTNNKMVFKDVYQLAEYASKVKKKCKQIWNNCFIIE